MHSNIDSVTSGQGRIKCHLCTKHMENITYLVAISITKIYISLTSKLAYIASQDNFSWLPNCLLPPPPPPMQNKVFLKINWYSLYDIHGFHVTRYMILKNGGQPTKSIVYRVLLILEHFTWFRIKA